MRKRKRENLQVLGRDKRGRIKVLEFDMHQGKGMLYELTQKHQEIDLMIFLTQLQTLKAKNINLCLDTRIHHHRHSSQLGWGQLQEFYFFILVYPGPITKC